MSGSMGRLSLRILLSQESRKRTTLQREPYLLLFILQYNDYNIEYPGPKSTAALGIVSMLQEAGLRIDGVGLQSHFVAGSTPTIDQQISNMEAFTALGVDVAITELDVRLLLPSNTTNLQQQSKDYEASVGACVQVEGCVGITVWDFWDPVCC